MNVPRTVVACPVVIGREEPLARLAAQAEQAPQTGTVTLISGDAGMGKSRLLDEAVTLAARSGFQILAGESRPESVSASEPFASAIGRYRRLLLPDEVERLFDGRARPARYLLPEDQPLPPATPASGQLAGAVVEVVRRLSTDAPLLLGLDDLQWASSEAVEILEMLTATAPELPVWLVGTYRPGEVTEAFDRVVDQVAARRTDEHMVLEPLGSDAVAEMLRATFDHDDFPKRFVHALHERSGGNPFVIEELCRALLADGVRLGDEAAHDRVAEVAVPETVRAALRSRIARLTPAAVDTLQVAAVAGVELDLDLIRRATGADRDELDARLTEVVRNGLVEERRDGPVPYYAFAHALTQEAIVADLAAPERHRHHRRIAEALRAIHGPTPGAVAGLLADHLVAAGEREAFTPALAAARYAASHALPHEATRRYAQAGELATDEDERVAVAVEAAEFRFYADRPAAAELALEAAAAARRNADAVSEARALIVLARARWIIDGTDAFDPLDRALTLVEGEGDEHELRALVEAAYHLARTGWRDDAERGRALFARAVPLAATIDDPRTLARFELTRAALAVTPDELLAASDRAVGHLKRTGDPFARATAEVVAGHHLTAFHGQLREGVRRQRRFQDAWDELTTKRPSVPFVGHAQGRMWLGDLDAAAALLEQGAWPDSRLSQAHWHEAASELSYLRGDAEEALAHARQSYALGSPTKEAFWLISGLAAVGRATWAVRGLAAAWPFWDRAVDIATRSNLTCHWLFSVDLCSALAGARDRAALDDVVGRLGAATEAAGRRGHDVAALAHIEGLAAHVAGHDETAGDRLREAVERYTVMPFPARRATALLALAEHERATGRQADGVAAGREALDLATEVGAVPIVREAEEVLGRFGRPGRRASSSRVGPAALTPREREVVRLTVEGLTAREVAARLVVSHRTVEGHLERARAKLGATSKVDLVRVALQDGL